MAKSMLVLTAEMVERLMSAQAWVDQVASSYVSYSNGKASSPLRQRIRLQPHFQGRTAFMSGFVGPAGALGCKIVGYYPENIARGHPAVEGVVVLVKPETGETLAILDGTRLTTLRTGAIVAVGVQQLSPHGGAEIGLFGTGALARTSVLMLRETCGLERVHIYSRSRERRDAFALEIAQRYGLAVEVCQCPDDVLAAAKVIVCATAAKEPVFSGASVQEGSFVISIGANTPDTRELDAQSISAGSLVVESREATLVECGELIIPIREGKFGPEIIQAEIGEIIAGLKPKPAAGRTLVFKSTGLAVQDLVVARELVRRAEALGEGQRIELR